MSDNQCPIPCFVCGKPLYEVGTQEEMNQPHEGTVFITNGHYGSTAFDPMDGSWLELNICDPCLRERSKLVLRGKQYAPRLPPRPQPIYNEWRPDV
jgi:hypothetical protein